MSRILDIDVTELHQRSPIFIGSEQMVRKAESFMAGELLPEVKELETVNAF